MRSPEGSSSLGDGFQASSLAGAQHHVGAIAKRQACDLASRAPGRRPTRSRSSPRESSLSPSDPGAASPVPCNYNPGAPCGRGGNSMTSEDRRLDLLEAMATARTIHRYRARSRSGRGPGEDPVRGHTRAPRDRTASPFASWCSATACEPSAPRRSSARAFARTGSASRPTEGWKEGSGADPTSR